LAGERARLEQERREVERLKMDLERKRLKAERARLEAERQRIAMARRPKTFTNSLGMKFVWITPGTFTMGSPSGESGRNDDETQHRVTLTRGFYMQTTEVTQGQWKAVMGTKPWAGVLLVREGSDYPAELVFVRNFSEE
jgi:formylglycine-generating enzyme required for sulfatase activity